MSKHDVAKAAQRYVDDLYYPDCGHCKNRVIKIELPEWMKKNNLRKVEHGHPEEFSLEKHGVEKQSRCRIGDFPVKKSGTCACWSAE